MTTTVRVRVVPTAPVIRARVTPASQPLQAALRNTGTLIQWRIGQDGDWQDLIEIDDIDASVEVGTVTTLAPGSPATVTNVGTAQAAVLDFGIPAGASGSGAVASVAAGTGIDVDNTDPNNPVVALDAGTQASLALADSALQSSAIGVSVQAYNANLTEWATLNPSANAGSLVTAADYAAMRTLLGLVIGTNVQAYDADLASWAGVTRASGFDTFTATPSSANLRSLLTDETGTGGAVFATSPTISGPTFTRAKIETVYTITDGAAFAVDPTNGEIQFVTLGASRTPVPANWSAGQTVTLRIADGTAYTITWSGFPIVWKGGSAPTLATTGYTEVNIEYAGGVYRGVHVGDFAS